MKHTVQALPFRRIGKDTLAQHTPVYRPVRQQHAVTEQLTDQRHRPTARPLQPMHNIVRVEHLDPQTLEKRREQTFTTGDSARYGHT